MVLEKRNSMIRAALAGDELVESGSKDRHPAGRGGLGSRTGKAKGECREWSGEASSGALACLPQGTEPRRKGGTPRPCAPGQGQGGVGSLTEWEGWQPGWFQEMRKPLVWPPVRGRTRGGSLQRSTGPGKLGAAAGLWIHSLTPHPSLLTAAVPCLLCVLGRRQRGVFTGGWRDRRGMTSAPAVRWPNTMCGEPRRCAPKPFLSAGQASQGAHGEAEKHTNHGPSPQGTEPRS